MIRPTVLLLFPLLVPLAAPAGSLPEGPYVSTSATGEHEVDPDHAVLSLSVERRAATSALAQEHLVEARNAVDAVLAGYADAIGEVELEQLSVSRVTEYDPESRRQVEAGFAGRFGLSVRVVDLGRLSALYHELAGLDPQNLDMPRFEVDDPEAALQAARDRALGNARAKAEAIASTQGAVLGPVWGLLVDPLHHLAGRVTEDVGGGMERMALSMRADSAPPGDIAIEPRPVRFQATVGVVYRLEPDEG
ncbi:MAG: SIMPL domain-containing protein [Wenzhouxiangellaceae bacterium]|nr:SIMPL domain-containing protein [Wenzhouxiangellaceae bacterium]